MSDHSQHRVAARPFDTEITFVEILHTLVNDFDVIDVLTQLTSRCVDLLNVQAAGILLADATGHLRIVGASSEQIRLLELFQLQCDQGPCLDSYKTGETVTAPNLDAPTPWPDFSAASVEAGYRSVYAIPLHHNSVTLGCLNLFKADVGPLSPSAAALAHALADVASVAIVQSHANQQPVDRDGRLNHALASRITIEQAKGMISEYFVVDVHEAFEMLRSLALVSNRSLTGTADLLVDGTIAIDSARRVTPPQQENPEVMVEASLDGRTRIVRLAGELDLVTRDASFDACVSGGSETVEVDISKITFMDCCGYGALMGARLALEQEGRSLIINHADGQPSYLVGLIAEYEDALPKLFEVQVDDVASPVRGRAADQPSGLNATARSVRRSIARLNPLQSRRPTAPPPSAAPVKAQRRTIMQVQPTAKSHTISHVDRQNKGQPRTP